MAAKRAVREFPVTGDPWAVVDGWAQGHGYSMVEQADGRRVYKKGTGFLTGARRIAFDATGGQLRLEAWVVGNLPVRIMSLFIIPKEITVESGGAKAMLPRKLGRGEVNDLLKEFGQPPIG
jgi:hypothetical protein